MKTLIFPPRRLSPVVVLIAAAAIVYTGYHVFIAFDQNDTNHLETPLLLALARQSRDGTAKLFGPFSSHNPLVLIHAPLYYRLAGAGAWALHRFGIDDEIAGLIAGRSLSFLSFLALLAAVWRLSGGDGKRSRFFAIGLVASCPILGSFAVTVRPDLTAIALQTWGIALAIEALRARRVSKRAAVAFALAFCVKQHAIVSAGVATGFVLWSRRKKELSTREVLVWSAIGIGIVVSYYGFEQIFTKGEMFHAVFALPASFARINRAGWGHVGTVFFQVAKLAIGLIAFAGAAAIVRIQDSRIQDSRIQDSKIFNQQILVFVYAFVETLAMVPLCWGSTGAWVNYAIQPAVLFCVGLAGVIERIESRERSPWTWKMFFMSLAATVLFANDVRLTEISRRSRREDQSALQILLKDERVGARWERYFVNAPQYNRLHGRADLAHDDWLYSSFESVSAAEPRDDWLARELTSGKVRVVIVAEDPARDPLAIEGVKTSLPDLGYCLDARIGRFDLWRRP